ncbi:S41 family peptidase [Candidatus Ruminimicrobium bovinum]|uniref:S41 family peptidase n=1 Tax=Candidatus Ruminimicrobium bovinum TaxID=3242779 RepID=UPI0039B8A75B
MKIKKFIALILTVSFIFSSNIFAASDETYDTLKMMVDIMEIVDKYYVDETKPKDLVTGAIRGMVQTLDPYSQFMDEKAYKEMKTETQGSFGGVGLRITMQDNILTVLTPIPDTPAYFAGILPDDKIIKIDDKSTEGMSSDEAVKLMRGNPGTKVKLTISRKGVKDELEFVIKRKTIKIESVKKQMLEDNIGYIQLYEFNAQSAADMAKMLKELSKDKMKALILDLRNNPGGLLDAAVNICELFIKQDSLVVSTRGRDKANEQFYSTKNKPTYPDLPFIILINRGSASASEIVSGTMQDYKRALIIGNNSFGKGSVQTIVPLTDGNALRLTIAKYYLPSGRNILKDKDNKKRGVTPDIFIDVTPEIEGKLYIQSQTVKIKGKNDKKKEAEEKAEDKVEDEILNTAIAVIKAGKVEEYIKNPSKYLKDNPKKEETSEDKDKNKDKENKTSQVKDTVKKVSDKKELKNGKTEKGK